MSEELAAVEFSHERGCYIAILSDGTEIALEAQSLFEAEREANRLLDHNVSSVGEFTSFRAHRMWD